MNASRARAAAGAALLVAGLAAGAAAGDGERMEILKKGRDAFLSQCLRCHQTADEAAAGYRRQPAWRDVVADMVARGAQLDLAQQEAVVQYLSGRMLLIAKCSSCHTSNRPLTRNKSLEQWRATVERMVQNMPAPLRPGPAQVEELAQFLAVERPSL
ncbi:MAG TPA: cytochrome c [bacterium]